MTGRKVTTTGDTLRTAVVRTDGELRNAQLVLASTALAHPRLGCVEKRETELEKVLGTLGLLRRIP